LVVCGNIQSTPPLGQLFPTRSETGGDTGDDERKDRDTPVLAVLLTPTGVRRD
jgi:hypothetical protein